MPNKILLWNKQTNAPEATDVATVREKVASGNYVEYAEGEATLADGQSRDLNAGGAFTSPLDRAQLGESLDTNLASKQQAHTADAREELFGGGANQLRAGAQGFLSAVTLGAVGQREGTPAEAVNEQNPGSNMAGHLLGILTTAAIPSSPVGALTEGTALLKAGVAARLGGGFGARVAGATVEGAAFGVAEELAHQTFDAALRDKDFVGEAILNQAGFGALMGGSLEGVLGAASAMKSVKGVKAKEIAEVVAPQVDVKAVTQTAGGALDSLNSALAPRQRVIESLQKLKASPDFLEQANGLTKQLVDDAIEDFGVKFNELAAAQKAMDKFKGTNPLDMDARQLKRYAEAWGDLQKVTDDIAATPINPKLVENLDLHIGYFNSLDDQIPRQIPLWDEPAAAKAVDAEVTAAGKKPQKAPPQGTLTDVNALKWSQAPKNTEFVPGQVTQEHFRGSEAVDYPGEAMRRGNIRELTTELRGPTLTDIRKYRPLEAPPPAAVPEPVMPARPTAREATPEELVAFAQRSRVRPQINEALDSLSSAAISDPLGGAALKLKEFADDLANKFPAHGGADALAAAHGLDGLVGRYSPYIDSLVDAWSFKQYADVIGKLAKDPKAPIPNRLLAQYQWDKTIPTELAGRPTQTEAALLNREERAAQRLAEKQKAEMRGGVSTGVRLAGSAVGAPGVSAIIAGGIGKLAAATVKVKDAIATSVEKALSSGRAAAATKLTTSLKATYTGNPSDETSDTIKRVEQLHSLALDPEAARERIRKALAPVVQLSPQMALQMEELQLSRLVNLSKRAPAFISAPGLVPDRPFGREWDAFQDYEAVTHNPDVAFAALSSHRLNKAMADALREQHPSLYAKAVQEAMDRLSGKDLSKLSLAQIEQLELLTGIPLRTTVIGQQAIYEKAKQEGRDTGGEPNPEAVPRPTMGQQLAAPPTR